MTSGRAPRAEVTVLDGRNTRRAAAGLDGAARTRPVSGGARRPLATRREAAHAREGLAALHAQEPDEGVDELVRVVVALRDAAIPDGLAVALARRAPAFTSALVRACELADELEGE